MAKYNKNQYTLQEVYAHYKKNVDDPVDYKTHKAIMDMWGELCVEFLVAGKDVRLFGGMSRLGVRKREVKAYIDRRASKLEGRLVMKPNSHSGFYLASTYWRRRYTKCNSRGWMFSASKLLARGISAVMKKPLGHMTYVKRARHATNTEVARQMFNRKVHKI